MKTIYRLTEFHASGDAFTSYYKTLREANAEAEIKHYLLSERERAKIWIFVNPVQWCSETKQFETVSEVLTECFDARNPVIEFDRFDDWEVIKIREKYTVKFDLLWFENKIEFEDASDDEMWEAVDFEIFKTLDNDNHSFIFTQEKEIIKEHFNNLFDELRS